MRAETQWARLVPAARVLNLSRGRVVNRRSVHDLLIESHAVRELPSTP
jgi:hypothetical protein